MIFLSPDMRPAERLAILETSARHAATRDDVRELVRLVRSRLARSTETDTARARRALVAAPPYPGNTPTTPGQWIDENVGATVRDGGDCVDRTHALLALAFAAGLDGEAVWLLEPGELDHVAPRLRSDGLWHWADALARPAMLGKAPQGSAWHTARGPVELV